MGNVALCINGTLHWHANDNALKIRKHAARLHDKSSCIHHFTSKLHCSCHIQDVGSSIVWGFEDEMSDRQARAIMQHIGGNVAHVHLEPGARVSYGPYREVSRSFIQMLRRFPAVAVVEKASIDEAYLLCLPQPGSREPFLMEQAVQLAESIKQTGAAEDSKSPHPPWARGGMSDG